jgi:hypothetical protein
MNLDEALEVLRKISREVIDYYLGISCPCAFPRYRFLVSFEGDTYSQALLHTFDTNVFVSTSVDKEKGFLISQGNDQYSCRVCGSTYQYSYDQYSITFEKVTLSQKKIVQKEIGAAATLPFPLFGGVYFVNGAWDQERHDQELMRLSKDFPHASEDEFRKWMQEIKPSTAT